MNMYLLHIMVNKATHGIVELRDSQTIYPFYTLLVLLCELFLSCLFGLTKHNCYIFRQTVILLLTLVPRLYNTCTLFIDVLVFF